MTRKLSESRNSKKYLEEKIGSKSRPISMEMKQKIEQAGEKANRNIKRNNTIYNQSNAHSNETIVCDNEVNVRNNIDDNCLDYVDYSQGNEEKGKQLLLKR